MNAGTQIDPTGKACSHHKIVTKVKIYDVMKISQSDFAGHD